MIENSYRAWAGSYLMADRPIQVRKRFAKHVAYQGEKSYSLE